MRLGFQVLLVAALAVALLAPAPAVAGQAGTPKEMVATYSSLADGILALKRTEENLVRSILAATFSHGMANLRHAVAAANSGDAAAAKTAVEALAADAGQLATEGDNAVGAIRKRLLEGGHHHNAAGEAQGIYDEGYVIVTRAAKAKLLASSRTIAGMATAPKADALEAEWKKVKAVVAELMKECRHDLPSAGPGHARGRTGRGAGPLPVRGGRRGACRRGSFPSPFRFVDVAPELGLTRVVLAGRPLKDHLLDSAGTGAAWLDYDRDGRLDCYIVNDWLIEGDRVTEKGKNALYRQEADGTFEDVTDAAGVGGEGHWGAGVFVADYDRDGWPDLLVTNFGPNVLYRNRGDGTFENVAREVGLESPGWNTGAAWFSADGDGDLDVYIAAYIDNSLEQVLAAKPTLPWRGMAKVAVGPFGLDGGADHYFRNDGGRFVDATLEAGMEDKGLGFGFSVRAADFDRDGDPDIYVANDSDPNYLFRNEGGGVFQEVATWTGCGLDENGAAQAGMGVAVGDVTANGELDIYVNHFSEDFSTLWQGIGGGLFEDVSRRTGVGPATYTTLAWGTAFPDLDNDGDLEIPVMNGHIYPQLNDHPELIGTYEQRNILLDNRGPGASPMFVDVTAAAGPGFEQVLSSRGLALADYDDDGDLDMLLTHLDAPPSLLRNDSEVGSWLVVVCEDEKGGIIPIRTEVEVTAGGRTQWRDIASGDSYMSSHDPRPHFGLGDAETVDEVKVTWPDKTVSVRKDVPARQILRIKKGT